MRVGAQGGGGGQVRENLEVVGSGEELEDEVEGGYVDCDTGQQGQQERHGRPAQGRLVTDISTEVTRACPSRRQDCMMERGFAGDGPKEGESIEHRQRGERLALTDNEDWAHGLVLLLSGPRRTSGPLPRFRLLLNFG